MFIPALFLRYLSSLEKLQKKQHLHCVTQPYSKYMSQARAWLKLPYKLGCITVEYKCIRIHLIGKVLGKRYRFQFVSYGSFLENFLNLILEIEIEKVLNLLHFPIIYHST